MLVSFFKGQSTSTNENDLNRGETKDTKPYVKNITDDDGKKSNEDGGEISAEEINKIMEETTQECELEARRALKNLEKDKNIMKRLQEIKGRQNEDVNKEGQAGFLKESEKNPYHFTTESYTRKITLSSHYLRKVWYFNK